MVINNWCIHKALYSTCEFWYVYSLLEALGHALIIMTVELYTANVMATHIENRHELKLDSLTLYGIWLWVFRISRWTLKIPDMNNLSFN